MRFTILGSGTSALNEKHHEAAYLLEHDKKYYLFDSGSGTKYQILKKGIKIQDIDYIFYTHFHNDHIVDLSAIIWTDKYHNEPKKTPLNIFGPTRMKEYVTILFSKIMLFNSEFEGTDNYKEKNKFPIIVKEITNTEFVLNGLTLKTKGLNHFGNIAYRIEHNGKSLVYTGDTSYCPEIIDICKEADYCIMDCGVLNQESKGHLYPEIVGEIASKANIKKLILTHMYPELNGVPVKEIIRKNYSGEIIFAEDFMEFEL